MKKIFLLSVLTSSFCFSQMAPGVPIAHNPCPIQNGNNPVCMQSPFHSFDNNPLRIAITGTPYIEEEYKTGVATILDKYGFKAPMRYNASKNVIEFLDEDFIVREVLRRPYISIDLDGKAYEIIDYVDGVEEKLAYFNPLNQGSVQLLFMPKKVFSVKNMGVLEGQGTYKEASTYYIKKKGKPAERIKLNEKNILIHLFDKGVEMNHYISKNGLNLKKEEDIVLLLEYYNSLSTPKQTIKEMQS